MKTTSRIVLISVVTTLFLSSVLFACNDAEKALWITVKEHGNLKTTIALTEDIARKLLESKDFHLNFSKTKEKSLITKKMLEDVLTGRETSVEARGEENETVVTLFMQNLDLPGKNKGEKRLIVETYKEGKRTFRMKLGEFEIESTDEESGDTEKHDLSWKTFLPFLAKSHGGIYIKDHSDNTEAWVYVE
jgi:hypothetical protein